MAYGFPKNRPAIDGNGNVIAYVDMATGAKSATYEYNAFGETIIADGPAASSIPFRFSTKYTDAETRLLYYGLRYYNPSTGRWPNRDPIAERGGINLYAAFSNDGVSRFDFLGLAVERYTGDISQLVLQPNTNPYQSVEDIHEGGEAGIGWPTPVAERTGTNVVISGKLTLNPTYRPENVKDPENSFLDRQGRTVGQHERAHGVIAADEWNRNLDLVNYWEGTYCLEVCAQLAVEIANLRNEVALHRARVRNADMDLDAYARDTSRQTRFDKKRAI